MKRELIEGIAIKLKSFGYRVYLSKTREYGFYTDGIRVVSFGGYWKTSVDFSGNYDSGPNAKSLGTGWKIEDGDMLSDITQDLAESFIRRDAPSWAVGHISVKYTTPEQHLKTYGQSSGYSEF